MGEVDLGTLATVLGVVASFVLGLFGFIRGMRSDHNTESFRDRELVMSAWRDLVGPLTEENSRCAKERDALRAELRQCQDELARLAKEVTNGG